MRMIICIGVTTMEFQRLIISSSLDQREEFTCGFDLKKEDVKKLIRVAQEMEKKFEEVKP